MLRRNKKILVTGGAGFVGRHLCFALLNQGATVTCVDNIVPLTGGICPLKKKTWPLYRPLDYQNFIYIKKDCRDYFNENPDEEFDEVYHLAAIVGGREMIENNPLAVAQDLAIDSLFWQWAKTAKPGKVICFSSSAAYPIQYQQKNNYRLLTEDLINFNESLGMPDMSYGWAKLTNEYLAKLAYEKHGIKSIIFRPFSGYGEDQDTTYPFPSICKRVLSIKNNHDSFLIWGSGNQLRDFIHIEDCVKGILIMKDKINDGSAVNLSTGKLTSFKEFASLAVHAAGYSPKIIGMREKPEGVFARGGDTQLQKKLGFESNITLQNGVMQMLRYCAEDKR